MKKLLSILLLIGLFQLSYGKVSAEITWTETFPTGAAENKGWKVAMDDDGSHLLVASNYFGAGRVYISSNGGTSWTETFPTGLAENKNWFSVAMDSDGSHIIAGVAAGRVYISSNGGTSWTETTPTGVAENKNWSTVASDADGSHLLATDGEYGGRIYISSNGGTSWTETTPTGVAEDKNWKVAMDADGSHLLATDGEYNGRVYISSNGGTSWTETIPTAIPGNSYTRVAIDADGSHLVVSVQYGRIYISSNGGTSWTETVLPGVEEGYFWNIAIDADGSHLVASAQGSRIYISSNGGTSWTETTPTGAAEDKNWDVVDISSYGLKLAAGVYAGRLYIGTLPQEIVVPEEESEPSVPAEVITTAVTSNPVASDPNVIPGWSLPIMAGPNFIGMHGFIPNTNISSIESRLASVFIDRTTHHDDLNIHHSDFNWMNILAFWNNPDEVKLPWTQGFNAVSEISKIEAKSSFNGYPVTETDHPFIILLGYDPNKLGSIPKEQLKIARFNETTKKWETINNPHVYTDNNQVATTTNKFGYFTVVYPRSWWGNR